MSDAAWVAVTVAYVATIVVMCVVVIARDRKVTK